jgi:hypothetical protein
MPFSVRPQRPPPAANGLFDHCRHELLQLAQRRRQVLGQLVHLGLRQHAAAGGDAELHLAGITLHRDVQADAVVRDRHR